MILKVRREINKVFDIESFCQTDLATLYQRLQMILGNLKRVLTTQQLAFGFYPPEELREEDLSGDR